MKRCLLISCSKAKTINRRLLPAIERYDGPNFQVLRRYLRETSKGKHDLMILILSAKFGLINGDQLVPNYDRRITIARAEEIRPKVLKFLKKEIADEQINEIFVLLGADYEAAIKGFEIVVPPETKIIPAKGGQGYKAQQLKRWLYGMNNRLSHTTKRNSSLPISKSARGHATIRGNDVRFTPAQITERVRSLLSDRSVTLQNIRDWYVTVDGKRIGPKWIVSQITGLPVSSFASRDARRVLSGLGIEVRHV